MPWFSISVLTASVVRIRQYTNRDNPAPPKFCIDDPHGNLLWLAPPENSPPSSEATDLGVWRDIVPGTTPRTSLRTRSALTVEFDPTDFPESLRIFRRSIATSPPYFEWTPGDPNPAPLPGTVRTLDNVLGKVELDCSKGALREDMHCEMGVISRVGWAVVERPHLEKLLTSYASDGGQEDTGGSRRCANIFPEGAPVDGSCSGDDAKANRMLSADVTGANATGAMNNGVHDCSLAAPDHDLLFFGHGHDFKRALGDFSLLFGALPALPTWAFGMWYSYGGTKRAQTAIHKHKLTQLSRCCCVQNRSPRPVLHAHLESCAFGVTSAGRPKRAACLLQQRQ